MEIGHYISEAIGDALEGELERLVREGREMLDRENRHDTRETGDEMYFSVDDEGDAVEGEYGSMSGHARWVHEGREPGKRPPIEPIRRWAERKLNIPESASAGVAFVIARKIGERGTKGTPFLMQPLEQSFPQLVEKVAGAGARGFAFGTELVLGDQEQYPTTRSRTTHRF